MVSTGKIVIFNTEEGNIAIDVKLYDNTVWLTKTQIATLYKRDRTVISRHIRNIIYDEELSYQGNVQKMHVANSSKLVEFYNLDMIISVGYRVNSKIGIQFRKWATKILHAYIVEGRSMNYERLDELRIGK